MPTPPEPPADALLAAAALACRRGERLLIQGLGVALRPGEITWLRGSNGRGKTTLLRVLAGLSSPDAGTLSWQGRAWKASRDDAARGTVYLAHANALKEDLTAQESLAFLARLHGQHAAPDAIVAALKGFSIASRRDAPVRTLSQGQRRRVALARLLLAPAKPLWLLDEPYDALDVDGCARLDEVLAAHVRGGGSVLLTSHLPLSLRDPSPRELVLQ